MKRATERWRQCMAHWLLEDSNRTLAAVRLREEGIRFQDYHDLILRGELASPAAVDEKKEPVP